MSNTAIITVVAIASVGGAVLTLALLLCAAPLFLSHLRGILRSEIDRQNRDLLDQLKRRLNAARTENDIGFELRGRLDRAAGESPMRGPRHQLHSVKR